MSAIANNPLRLNPRSNSALPPAIMEPLEPRLLLSGDGIDVEKFVYVEAAPDAGDIMCNDYAYGKPVELTMKYTGGGADATDTLQPPGKYAVTDEPGFEPFEAIVDIIASSASNLSCVSPGNTFFSGEDIALGDEFVLDVDNAACLDRFKSNTYIYIMDADDGDLLQTVQYHTSCSAPIQLGDVVGGIEVNGFFGTNGIGADLDDADEEGYGDDADTPAEAVNADIGRTVVWTYAVTRTGDGLLSDFEIVDDNGTPGNDADDFTPTEVMDGDFNVGDTNTDGVLDAGEQWLFAAADLVEAEGLYGNIGYVSASVEGDAGGDAGFTEYAVLADDGIMSFNSFSVTGGFVGSNGGDVLSFGGLNVPMGIRGGGALSEFGFSTIGTAGSDAIVFNGGVMVNFMTTVEGDIHTGGVLQTEIVGASVNGGIYTTEDPGDVSILFGGTVSGGIHPGVPQPFETVNLPTPLPFNSSDSLADPYVPDYGQYPLAAGNHYFDSLTLGDYTTMKLPINGAVVIHVAGDMTVGSNFEMIFVDDFGDPLDLEPADFSAAADEVYIQIGNLPADGELPVFSSLSAGDNATWFGTVYAPDGDLFFGSGLDLKGALYSGGFMSFFDNTAVEYEELNFGAVGIDAGGAGGAGGGTTPLSDSDSAYYTGVLPSIDISRLGQKAEALVMQYTGDPTDTSPVRIVASSRSDIDDPKADIYFDGEISLGETFAIDALFAGKSRLRGETYVMIFATTGELLGSVQFHTSLSEPLVLGDQFGAIRLVGFIGNHGARAGIVPVEMLTGLSGFVFEDFNDDGLVDLDEYAISGATVTLTGVDDNGAAVNRVELTDSDGAYYFDALRPGKYTIAQQTQPVGYTDGIDSVGTADGTLPAGTNDVISEINLDAYVEGVNYNFAEHRAETGAGQIVLGQTATIGFWAGRKGKK
ncbi:MAG: SdrD B-like domain-containing protein, partial [Phycisphaerae bacterium]|nr:SdrD B-like domain-containing protein [Phycisphaerae bacterium]